MVAIFAELVLSFWPLKFAISRWVAATAVSVAVTSWGHGRKSLSTSGALLALLGMSYH